jgi:hypothetical protein
VDFHLQLSNMRGTQERPLEFLLRSGLFILAFS